MNKVEAVEAVPQAVQDGRRPPLSDSWWFDEIAGLEQEEAAMHLQRKLQAETRRLYRKEGRKKQKKERSTFYSQLTTGSRFYLSCKDEALKGRSGIVYQKFNNAWARVIVGVEEETKWLLLGDWKVMSPEIEIIPAKG